MEKKGDWKKAAWHFFSGLLISFNGVTLFLLTYRNNGIGVDRTWITGILCLLCMIGGVMDFCRGVSLLRGGDKVKDK